jgi:arylsulfatase A-like enzyme
MSSRRARNVVLISLDTLRYDCVGACPEKAHVRAYGLEEAVRTPNLDEFLGGSLYFAAARSAAPYTPASHATVMTGLYPAAHGVRPFYRWALAQGVGTLAEELRSRGWRTACAQEDGTDTSLRSTQVLRGIDATFREEEEACRWCAAHDGPVLLFLHTMDAHAPYAVSKINELGEQSEESWASAVGEVRRRLGAPPELEAPAEKMALHRWAAVQARQRLSDGDCVRMYLDWYLRGVRLLDRLRWPRIVAALRGAGLYDDALIILFADHGEAALPDWSRMPLDHPESLLEDVLRVPLAVRGPGVEPAVVGAPVCLTDVTPTVLDYLGIEPTVVGRGGAMEGRSLLSGELRPEAAARVLFAEKWAYLGPRNEGPDGWREQRFNESSPHQVSARRGDLKLTWHPGEPILGRYVPRRELGPLRRLYRAAVPHAVRAFLAGCLGRRAPGVTGAGRQAGGTAAPAQVNAWREAPLFVSDLRADPLETKPRYRTERELKGPERELLEAVRQYWTNGVAGSEIALDADQQASVLKRLNELGYVD